MGEMTHFLRKNILIEDIVEDIFKINLILHYCSYYFKMKLQMLKIKQTTSHTPKKFVNF